MTTKKYNNKVTMRTCDMNCVHAKASFALSFVMLTSGSSATDGLKKLVICSEAPPWVFDLFNQARNDAGIIDHRRQLFVREALYAISRDRPLSVHRHGDKRLQQWAKSAKERRVYVKDSKNLREAYEKERREVYQMTREHLQMAT